MNISQQLIALYTLVRKELVRMFRIFTQVFLPSVITTVLYFLIFGAIIGSRVGSINGLDYGLFIAPGLIMMSVITNSYSNVSSSLFSARFMNNIEEMLISPMYPGFLLLGFVIGGVLRGVIVAILVYAVSYMFVDLDIHQLPMTLLVVTLVAFFFALAGFTNGLFARNFDDVAIVPTFILTPLTYLGGVFYASSMLPPFWQKIMYINPIFYMINALRHVMTGQQEIDMHVAMLGLVVILVILMVVNIILVRRGIGIRD